MRHVLQDPVAFPVDDATRAGEVRRAAVELAAAVGFREEDRGRVGLVATEAATNLFKHATGGEVVLRSLSAAEGGGVEILAVDRGLDMELEDGLLLEATLFGILCGTEDLKEGMNAFLEKRKAAFRGK